MIDYKGLVSVTVGSQPCTIQSSSDTQITCELASSSAGSKNVLVKLNNQGYSNSDKSYEFDLQIASTSNSQGSIGGSLSLTISGQGFSSNTTVTICGSSCPLTQSSVTSVTCKVI